MKRRKFFIALITPLVAPLVAALIAPLIAPMALSGAAYAQQGQGENTGAFISIIDDLPLMPGLVEEAGGVVFDSPGGRIVQAYAIGDVSQGAVRAFYGETLPQLGWRPLSVGVYQRESEILKVEFPGGPGAPPPLTVGFSLAPKGP